MERLRYEVPSIERKDDAIEYIKEFLEYNSKINGVGALDKHLENYEGWLKRLEEERILIPNKNIVPAVTYFLVRESDDKIVFMINIRLTLNERLKKIGGHIGYSIRPTERRKGYNKINLYLGLLECQKRGINEVFLDCDKDNLASAKTMIALGAKLIKEYYEDEIYNTIIQKYVINVNNSLEEYADTYSMYI